MKWPSRLVVTAAVIKSEVVSVGVVSSEDDRALGKVDGCGGDGAGSADVRSRTEVGLVKLVELCGHTAQSE